MKTMFPQFLTGLLISGAIQISPQVACAAEPLENGHLRVEFGSHGITLLHDKTSNRTLHFERDAFSVGLDGRVIDSEFLSPTEERSEPGRRVFAYTSGAQSVRVIYELQPNWHFVSKQVAVHGPGERACRMQRIELCRGQVGEPVQGDHQIRDSLLLRFGNPTTPSHGVFFMLQNPFSQIRRAAERFSIAYAPETPWKSKEPYLSDRLLIGMYSMSGIRLPAQMEPEWRWVPPGTPREGAWFDSAEIDALVEVVRAFLTYKPERSVRVHLGWCENDYQIDIGTAEGRAEYRRILHQAAAVGCGHVLVTPANNPLAPLSENQDAWGWENLLWFNLGQKIRKDEWDPAQHPIPASVQSVLDDCKARGLKPMAYVYPTLPFRQNPEWTSWFPAKERGPYQGADTGQRTLMGATSTWRVCWANRGRFALCPSPFPRTKEFAP